MRFSRSSLSASPRGFSNSYARCILLHHRRTWREQFEDTILLADLAALAVGQRRPSSRIDGVAARALSDIATIGVLQERIVAKSLSDASGLQQALNSRIRIEQAKGILAQRESVTIDEALLTKHSKYFEHSPVGTIFGSRKWPKPSSSATWMSTRPCSTGVTIVRGGYSMRVTDYASSDLVSLRFGSDEQPGIRRIGTKRFKYLSDASGRPAKAADLERIRVLAVPPAWTKVWIAADADSHLQATGRDARGRKQYRYHPAFTALTADNKFADLVMFGHHLGGLRRRVTRDLARPTLDHDLVVATVVRLIDITSLRIGNDEYARTNKSFGVTTLRNKHAAVRGSTIRIAFRGKSKHQFDVSIDSVRLAKIVRRCQHLPGQHLFEYRSEDGNVRAVTSNDVNAYLSEHAGPGVTAKTFRTWNATSLAAEQLAGAGEHIDTATTRVLNEVIDFVADHLGNTRSVCRNSYLHPAVIESYLNGTLRAQWSRPIGATPAGLTVAERKALRLLKRSRRG